MYAGPWSAGHAVVTAGGGGVFDELDELALKEWIVFDGRSWYEHLLAGADVAVRCIKVGGTGGKDAALCWCGGYEVLVEVLMSACARLQV